MLFILYKSLRIAPKNFIFMAACCSDASNGQESSVSPLNRCPRLIRRPERDLVRYPFCCYHGLFRSKNAVQNNIFHFFYILLGDYNCRKFFGNYNATATYSVNQNKTKQLTLLNPSLIFFEGFYSVWYLVSYSLLYGRLSALQFWFLVHM